MVSNEIEISNHMNNFFIGAGQYLINKCVIIDSSRTLCNYNVGNEFNFSEKSVSQVRNIILGCKWSRQYFQ